MSVRFAPFQGAAPLSQSGSSSLPKAGIRAAAIAIASFAVLAIGAAAVPVEACAQTPAWSTVTTTQGQGGAVNAAASGRQGGAQANRPAARDRPGVQVYGTTGTVGRRETTTTAQVWSTTPGTTIQSGTVYYGPDGQAIGVSPGLSTGGQVYVPVPVPVAPYPPPHHGYPGRPGYPGYPGYPGHSGYTGPSSGWAPQPGRSDGHPYGPDVVPGWGGQRAPDYRNSPQALPPNQPGYYYGRPR